MEFLNNREWAILFWFFTFLFYALLKKQLREALKNIFHTFFQWKIQIPIFLMAMYMGGVVYLLFKLHLWDSSQIKNTIIWGGSVGFMSFFRIQSLQENNNFFRQIILDNIKLVSILEFVANVYTFPLIGELILFPFLIVIGAMIAISERDKEYAVVTKLLNSIAVIIGILIILYTVFKLFQEFGKFAQIKTVYDFFVPPLLTLAYLPFIFCLTVYSSYEQANIRAKFAIKDKKIKLWAMFYAAIIFNFRFKLLERWSYSLRLFDTTTSQGIYDSFKYIFARRKLEKNPPFVSTDEGWSPFVATEFLQTFHFKMNYYGKVAKGGDSWQSQSQQLKLDKDFFSDSVQYYVEGTDRAAKTLTLDLMVNNSTDAMISHLIFLEFSNILCEAAISRELPETIKECILSGISIEEEIEHYKITLNKTEFPSHINSGYSLVFSISII